MKKWLISVFDYTGNASRPYEESGEWEVTRIDIQNGVDFLEFDFIRELNKREEYGTYPEIGVIAMVPCTHDAISGAKHFAKKDANGITKETDVLVDRLRHMIHFFDTMRVLRFWQVEQPRTRLHNRHPWLKPITQKFNPCDFAGYDPMPENSQYNKETWLFGRFNKMQPKRLEPLTKENPGWKKYGGKSLRTKNLRSTTPLGFAYAFYDANK